MLITLAYLESGTQKSVYILDALLTPEQCRYYCALIDARKPKHRNGLQNIVTDKTLSTQLWREIWPRLKHAKLIYRGKAHRIVTCSPHVTLTCRSYKVCTHKDTVKDSGETFKLGIYLNAYKTTGTGGGTAFHDSKLRRQRKFIAAHARGRAILFDMGLYHSGEKRVPSETKYMIGLRVHTVPL